MATTTTTTVLTTSHRLMMMTLLLLLRGIIGIGGGGGVAVESVDGATVSPATFHIDTNHVSAGDPNAIFYYRGYWHLMMQYVPLPPQSSAPPRAPRPISSDTTATGWGHIVSANLRSWKRLPNALVGGPDHFDAHGVWDGSFSILDGHPYIMYDAYSGPSGGGGGNGSVSQLGNDPPTIAIARAANESDPLLLEWTKDPLGLMAFDGPVGSGPSPMWRNGDHVNFIMALNGKTARYTSNDPTLHHWHNADSEFLSWWGCCGALFRDLPVNFAPNTPYTHLMESDSMKMSFLMGVFDGKTEKFVNTTVGNNIDFGEIFYPTIGYDKVSSSSRLLFIGWMKPIARLSVMRDIKYEASTNLLVSNPLEELDGLRQHVLLHAEAVNVGPPTSPLQLPLDNFNGSGMAVDVAGFFEISSTYSGALDFALLSSENSNRVVSISFVVSRTHSGNQQVQTSIGGSSLKSLSTFPLTKEDNSRIFMRVLVDHSIVEVFTGGGRVNYSFLVDPSSVQAVRFASPQQGVKASIDVWKMTSIDV